MAWFNAAAPAAGDDVGDGDDQIRALKLKLNTDLQNVGIEWDGAAAHPFQGFLRTYHALDGAPPAPPAPYEQGRLWYVSDLGLLRYHDGANWVDLQQRVTVIQFDHGAPNVFDTAAAWVAKSFVPLTGVIDSADFALGDGWRFNANWCPAGSEIYFSAGGALTTGAGLGARIWDVASAAPLAGSTLGFAGATVVDTQSADLTAAIVALGGNRRFVIQVRTTGGFGTLFYSELRIVR